jgi:hypothetical protein
LLALNQTFNKLKVHSMFELIISEKQKFLNYNKKSKIFNISLLKTQKHNSYKL